MTLKEKYEITQGDGNLKGICGFTTMSQFVIDHGKISLKDYEKQYGKNTIKFAKEWIDRQLKFDAKVKKKNPNEVTSLQASLAYTREFKGFENFIEDKEHPPSAEELTALLKDPKKWDGLALVPEAIIQYIKKHYDISLKVSIYTDNGGKGKNIGDLWKATNNNLGHGIYGVKLPVQEGGIEAGAPVSSKKRFKGESQVAHYVYIDKAGNLMTWGSQNDKAANQGDALTQITGDFGYVYVRLAP